MSGFRSFFRTTRNRTRNAQALGRAARAAAFCILLAAGCLNRESRVSEPPVRLPGEFSRSGSVSAPERWWLALGDEELSRLVDEALSSNMSLRGAWDRLEQACAAARREKAGLLPSLDGTAGVSRSVMRTDLRDSPTASESATTEFWDTYSLGLAASYEVDLWGRVRSTRDAAALDLLASEQDLHAAAMSLSAEVAGSWYRLLELRGQLDLLDQQIQTNKDYLETVTARFRRGHVPAVDVLQQQQTLESTRGERVLVRSALEVEENRLAVLLGRAPVEFKAPAGSGMPELPPLPATGALAEWVQRRPDIRNAYIRVQAADRRVAAAIADRFPRISLSASASTSAEHVNALFDNWLASIAANLAAPLFDAGRRKAEVRRTRAVASERLHDYGSVLLRSLEEVESALLQEARQKEYVESLERQLALSRQSMERTLSGYSKGTVDFTRLLTTLQSHQRLERSRLQAQRELVILRISLYRSLGGSWDLSPEKQAEDSTPPGLPDDERSDEETVGSSQISGEEHEHE